MHIHKYIYVFIYIYTYLSLSLSLSLCLSLSIYTYIISDFVHCTAYVNVHNVGGGCILYQSLAYAIYVYIYIHIYLYTYTAKIPNICTYIRRNKQAQTIKSLPHQTHAHAETHTHMQKHTRTTVSIGSLSFSHLLQYLLQHTATHCNTLHHTATHSNNTHTHSCIHLLANFLCLSLHACM